jgi:Na+/H+ antiporter NhaB
MEQLRKEFEELKTQHSKLEKKLDANTATTNEIKESTETIVKFFDDFRAVLRFLGILAIVGKWLAGVMAGIGAIFAGWHLIKNGLPPTSSK